MNEIVFVLITMAIVYKIYTLFHTSTMTSVEQCMDDEKETIGNKTEGFWQSSMTTCKKILDKRYVLLIAIWIMIVAIVYYMHPNNWRAWYGNSDFGSAQFWLLQAIAFGVIVAASKGEGDWGSAIVTLFVIIVSWFYYTGYKGIETHSANIVRGVNSHASNVTESRCVITFSDTNERWACIIKQDSEKIRVVQYSNVSRDVRKYNGKCSRGNKCNGTFISENDALFDNGVFDLHHTGNGRFVGHMRGNPTDRLSNPQEVKMQVDLISG